MSPIALKLKLFIQQHVNSSLTADQLVAEFFRLYGDLFDSITEEERWALVADLNQMIKQINLDCIHRKLGL